MALNINTNLTNNLDGYLLDAKNVKGTYVVVEDREALQNLPQATKVVGTLAYVQDISGGDSDSHYFMYTSSGWKVVNLENKYEVLNTGESFSIQTYTFDSNINFFNVLEYQTILVIFYDTTSPFLAFSTAGITLPNSGNPIVKLTGLITYNDKQYLAILELRGGSSFNNATLSFQELQAGSSGGGGAGSTKTLYHIEVEDSNGDKAIIPIGEDAFNDYITEMNQVGQQLATALGITWTTITDIDGLKDTFDDLKDTQLSYGCDLAMNLLVKYAYESGENPVLSFNNRALEWSVNRITNYDLANNGLGSIISLEYDSQDVSTLDDLYWFKPQALSNIAEITINSNATFTYTAEQIATGGGSSEGSGDGSIYTFRIKINTPPLYVEYSAFDTYADYVGFYVEYNNEYVLVTGDNKESVGIVLNSTMAYTQNTLPNTPYSYLYFDINEVYFNDSGVIKDLNAMLESAGASTLDSLDDLPTYWNSADVNSKSFLVNTISSMGNNFKREFGSNDLLEDGFYSVADYTYLESSSNGDSITWHGYTINQNSYFDLSSFANDGIMEYVGKTGGGSGTGTGGSGKLYELNMELTRYDNNGDQVGFGSLQSEDLGVSYTPNQDYTLDLTLDIYESNFENIKTKLNALIDLVNQQTSGSIPHLTDINSLVSFINSTLDESVADGDTLGALLLNELIPLCDNVYYTDASTTPAPHKYNIIGVNLIGWTIGYYNNNALCGVKTIFGVNSDDIYYAFDCNNSCTLTEYGTSGSGGSTTPTDSVGDNYIIKFTCEKTLTNPEDQTDVQTLTDKYQLLISEKIFENFVEGQQDVPASTLPELVEYANNNTMYKQSLLAYFLIGMASTCSGFVWKYEYDAGYHLNQLIVQNVNFTQMSAENYTSMSDWTIENIPDKVGGSGGGGSQPVTTQQKWYEWTLHTETSLSVGDNRLEFRIKEEQFNEFLTAVNQVMSQQDPTWTNITDKTGLIALFDTLKANASDSTTFQMIATLFGVAKYSIINNHENVLFWVQDQSNIDYGSFYVVDVVTVFDTLYALKIRNYSNQSVSTGIIVNDSTNQDSLLYINSNSTLTITETYE